MCVLDLSWDSLCLSRLGLKVFNGIIFLAAFCSVGVCIFLYYDEVASALSHWSLLAVVLIISVPTMLFSLLGCKTAYDDEKKENSWRMLYLIFLFVLFLADVYFGCSAYGLNSSLQAAQGRDYNIQADTPEGRVVRFLHGQLKEFYEKKGCTGGGANSTKIPIKFCDIKCDKSRVRASVITSIFKNQVIEDLDHLYKYGNCTLDPEYTTLGQSPSNFTQAFCVSEASIVDLAQHYSNTLFWCPVILGVITFLLMVATIVVIQYQPDQDEKADKSRPMADQNASIEEKKKTMDTPKQGDVEMQNPSDEREKTRDTRKEGDGEKQVADKKEGEGEGGKPSTSQPTSASKEGAGKEPEPILDKDENVAETQR